MLRDDVCVDASEETSYRYTDCRKRDYKGMKISMKMLQVFFSFYTVVNFIRLEERCTVVNGNKNVYLPCLFDF